MLGLLVSRGGYPLSYALFNGAQFEGYTMIPIVDDFVQRYNLGSDFVVIADSGLMSDKNVKLLRSAGYKYIIGARIKKESGAMNDLILSTPHEQGVFNDVPYGGGDRLIVITFISLPTKSSRPPWRPCKPYFIPMVLRPSVIWDGSVMSLDITQ